MLINRNTLGHLEEATFILVKASEERIGVLQCTSKTWTHKFNDLDTISFEIPYLTDGEETPYYDLIDVMKYVEVPEISARFSIKDVEIINEGQKTEYKSVTCQSYECQLGQRYLEDFSINTGLTGAIDGVSFYSPGDQTHSLLHLVVSEKAPEWSFGHISNSLRTKKRSFEVSRQDIYGFLMEDVAQAFECIFTFDTINKEINAYEVDEYGIDTNVHLSYNNLLEKAQLSYSIDEIKTCVTLKGSDDLSVREVNRGFDRIYDFSFWADEEYWSQSLLNAYNAWNTLVESAVDLNLFTYKTGVITKAELQGKNYDQAYAVLLAKYQGYYTDLSKWSSTLMPYGINTRFPGYGTISYTESGSDAVTFERQTSTLLVTSLPSTGNTTTLYLIKNTNNMYRWNGSWVDVNKWYNCNLATLKEKLAAAEKTQSVAMKSGYGDAESTDTTIQKRYVDTYLPSVYTINALNAQISTVKTTIAGIEENQSIIQTDKTVIVNKTSMQNNFTTAQLKELSTFIREEELSSDNYVVTDVMTEDERFDMLYDFLEYGEQELSKISSPQIQFTVDMENLFALSEFDIYSGDFDLGNYVWVTLRDDYSIKAKILEISIDFLDQSVFSVTFGNIMRKARNIFTDVTEALNTATSAATSVSMNASYWSASAEETDSIGQALASGLLSQQYYLSNAEDNETLIDENGLWITTTTGAHGRLNTGDYDSIYLGGGRILFTDDGWRSVSMSVGRADVDMPSINSSGQLVFTKESLFGTFADFLIAGYVGGSIIVGGDIYSANYKTSSSKTSGNAGSHLNLTDGTFEFNSKNSGKKRLTLDGDTLEVHGIIQASSGHIGCDDNGNGGFVIESNKLYNGKNALNSTSPGVYVGTDGISLGAYNTSTSKNPFSVNNNGYLVSTSGNIGGFNITNTSLYNGKSSLESTQNGVYVGTDGISLGATYSGNIPFKVTNTGALTAKSGEIGGWTIGANKLSASNIDISSTGSIKHQNGDESNWGISSSGYAYFKDVYITGVNGGSSFGSIGYDGSNTWGSFGLGSFYGSNLLTPFGGTCIPYIEELAVGQITAENIAAKQLDIDDCGFYYGGVQVVWSDISYVTSVSLEKVGDITINTNLSFSDVEVVASGGGTVKVLKSISGGDLYKIPASFKVTYTKQKSTVLGAKTDTGGESSITYNNNT